MVYHTNNDEYVFRQNDFASCYFIIDQGKVSVEVNGKTRMDLERANGFGDLALLYKAPRSASIRCHGTCYFWVIDQFTFKSAIEECILSTYDTNRALLETISFFGIEI
jgi:CRP-like cAMP-binding protein